MLSHALRGLSDSHEWLLQTIAAFRMPTTYATLRALAVASPPPLSLPQGRFGDLTALDAALTELEDRGLVGWDRSGNRYDLHPIVRGVVWNSLDAARRREVCQTLQTHFQTIEVSDFLNVTNVEDLTPAIELFHALIELGRFDDACIVFRDRLEDATLWRLSASRLRIELVERLFPDGTDQLPRLRAPSDQSFTLNALALAYQVSGQPGAVAPRVWSLGACQRTRSPERPPA